jgi:hypothetical protein
MLTSKSEFPYSPFLKERQGILVKIVSLLKRGTVPFLVPILLFALGATLSAQFDNLSAQAPPGTMSASTSYALSVLLWGFGVSGFVMIVFGLIRALRHPGEHLPGVIAAGGIMMLGAALGGILKIIFHPGA